MIRRALVVAAAAFALILAPSAAMAYNAPGFTSSVSDPTPALGAPVTVVISGVKAHEEVTLTISSTPASISNDAIQIAGIKSRTKTARASGVVSFTVTLTAAGSYALSATNAAGAVISTQTLTAGAAAAAPAAPAAFKGSQLSSTGFGGAGLAVGGGVLVLLGAGAVLVARRRKSAKVHD